MEDAGGRPLQPRDFAAGVRAAPRQATPEPPDVSAVVDPPRFEAPDPFFLHPRSRGRSNPSAVWDETSGLDLATLWQKGERTASPNCPLLGLRFVEVAERSVTLAMPASLWFCTGFGVFYGGVLTVLADSAINTAVTTTLPPADTFATVDLKVNFLRPVTPDGRRDLFAQGHRRAA